MKKERDIYFYGVSSNGNALIFPKKKVKLSLLKRIKNWIEDKLYYWLNF